MKKRRREQGVNFKRYLGIISILAFIGVFLNSMTGLDLEVWMHGLLFVIMGVALMLNGRIQLFLDYFKRGLTSNDMNKVVTNIIGLASFLTGLAIMLRMDYPIIHGTKTIIAMLAILIIAADLYKDKRTNM